MATKPTKSSKLWNVFLWIGQLILAGMFLMAGYMKTFVPIPELSQVIPMAGEMPGLTRFIGVSELAGGIGLLLPAALRILPQLTIAAAYALGVVMVLAILFHIQRGEYDALPTTFVLGAIAFFVGWGRTSKAPIRARSSESTVSKQTA
ncbi:MAG TPA: DoxX family protein [Ohtaekwangia sp.]|nr:DoxX family protein [Ohtaekwangia sp.]